MLTVKRSVQCLQLKSSAEAIMCGLEETNCQSSVPMLAMYIHQGVLLLMRKQVVSLGRTSVEASPYLTGTTYQVITVDAVQAK